MTRRIINLTPHDINICTKDHKIKHRFPSMGIARAGKHVVVKEKLDGVEIVQIRPTALIDLPDPHPDVLYIVSAITANAARHLGRATYDLLLTTEVVFDHRKRIMGCRRLALFTVPPGQ